MGSSGQRGSGKLPSAVELQVTAKHELSETEAGDIEVKEEAAEGAQKEAAVEETAGEEGATRRGKMIWSCERRGEQQI